jgi:hypothetical protein
VKLKTELKSPLGDLGVDSSGRAGEQQQETRLRHCSMSYMMFSPPGFNGVGLSFFVLFRILMFSLN